MKLFKKTSILLVISSLVSFTALGSTDSTERRRHITEVVSEKTDQSFDLIYRGDHPERVVVRIFDKFGNKVYTDVIHSERNFRRPYDFSTLPKSEYRIVVNDREETFEHYVNTFPKGLENVTYELKQSGDQYRLAVRNAEGKNIKVVIYANDDDLVYQDRISDRRSFAVTYDMSKVHAKAFDFQVYCEDVLLK